jgi:AraC-like DNA-binding protein
MTFYNKEVERIGKAFYPHDDLTKQVIQSKVFIDKHFSSEISLDMIAAEAHISKFHFIRLFRKYYGCTPNQYLQEVRINKAKKLLQSGRSLDVVCMAVGFTSKTSFIALFKKMTSITPLRFQKNKRAILKND